MFRSIYNIIRSISLSAAARVALLSIVLLLVASCSVTKNLPDGERLYVGQKSMLIDNPEPTEVGTTALEEVEAALATAPNNAFMGSSSIRMPLPTGLWFYNAFVNSEDGIGKWLFNRFAATPVLMSNVNPAIRVQAAENILREYGYFNGRVSYQEFPSKKDSLQVKLQYTVDMDRPYTIDTVMYKGFSDDIMNIFNRAQRNSNIRQGTQFNITDLDNERTRLSNLLRNLGRYYYRPDYLIYQADTTQREGQHVSLRLVPAEGVPQDAERAFIIGNTTVNISGRHGESPDTGFVYRGVRMNYHDRMPVRRRQLYEWLDYHSYRRKRSMDDSTGVSRRAPRNLYSLHRSTRIQEKLAELDIFRYVEMQYVPRDSTLTSDTLDVVLNLMMDKPYNMEADFNVKMKSNNQTGPGASMTLTKSNVFGRGELWSIALDGSYEWQTGRNSSSDMNSYEIGLSTGLTFPRLLWWKIGKQQYDFPATTTLQISARQLNRPKYYRMLSFSSNVTYDIRPSDVLKLSFTPLKLTYNMLGRETDEFRQLQEKNPALYISLRDQLIPAMEYTLTYDNASKRGVRHPIWWQTTVSEAGNLVALASAASGASLNKSGKKIVGVPFAQYLKLNSEFRYHYNLSEHSMLAARVAAGVVWSYGNATTAPYTEQFYIGGANSVRAFSARNIGPGGYPPEENNKYAFINHVGDMRFEANLEYRFRMVNDLHGAVFLDSGNVWLLRNDESRPNAQFKPKNFFKQLALGTGVGLRYDMDYLVFRLDLGIALHDPYDTGKSGYYNIPHFKDGLALHFAIGYPF